MRPKLDKNLKYNEIVKQLALLDMKRAEYVKLLRSNPEYAKKCIEDTFKDKIEGKFFNTLNENKFYRVDKCSIEYNTQFIVVLTCTLYEDGKKDTNITYKIQSEELPNNVENWLSLGNKKLTSTEIKLKLKKSLDAEKKRLEEEMKIINLRIKELNNKI